MKLQVVTLAMVGALLASVALGHEPVTIPPAAAPTPHDVRLLDAVPNYAEVIVHQWSDGVPEDVLGAERSVEPYGRLTEGAAMQATSLAECISLALQNNTDLQIQRLGPISAAAQVRGARAVFDPVLFGDVTRDRRQTPAVSILSGTGTQFSQNLNLDAGIRKMLLSGGQLSLSFQNNMAQGPNALHHRVSQSTLEELG